MGLTGIDRSVQRHSNHAADDIMLKSYQTINAKNNTISAESRTFADAVEAKIISLFAYNEVALAAQLTVYLNLKQDGGVLTSVSPKY